MITILFNYTIVIEMKINTYVGLSNKKQTFVIYDIRC